MPTLETLVTVAIPVYNGARFLGAALGSALGQTHRRLEVLLYDDASSDDSLAIAGKCNDDRLRILAGAQNHGVGAARQALKTAARGAYLIWLDADDVFEPTRVEHLLRTARATGADLVTDASGYLDEDGATLPGVKRVPAHVTEDPYFTRLFERNVMNPHPLVSRACFEAIDFDAGLRVSEDYDFWLQASRRGFRFAAVPDVLHRYRLVRGSLSSDPAAARGAVRRLLSRYSVVELEELYRGRGFAEGTVRYMACLQHLFRGEYAEALSCTDGPWAEQANADQDFYRGALALQCDQSRLAGACLQRHLARFPESPAGWNNLGVWRRRQGQPAAAEWARALALFPGYQDPRANQDGREAVTLTQLAPRRPR